MFGDLGTQAYNALKHNRRRSLLEQLDDVRRRASRTAGRVPVAARDGRRARARGTVSRRRAVDDDRRARAARRTRGGGDRHLRDTPRLDLHRCRYRHRYRRLRRGGRAH